MVQVDVFWGYGWGASLAVACGRALAQRDKPTDSAFWANTLIFLSLFWAPTGLLLLIRHPSWETMQAADSFYDMSEWIVLAFGITNITQGMLGFWIGQRLMRSGRYYLAQLNWVVGFYGMFFILLYGWDGLGYDRFLYQRELLPGNPAWTPGAGTGAGPIHAITQFLGTFTTPTGGPTVFTTLLTDGLWLLPPFGFLFWRWYTQDARLDGAQAPGMLKMLASYLGGAFIIGFGTAAVSALVVGGLGQIFGVGEVILHGGYYAPENIAPHVLSYLVGLPLSLAAMWYLLLKPGRPFFWILQPLMAGADERGLRRQARA